MSDWNGHIDFTRRLGIDARPFPDTSHHGHAKEIALKLPLAYDAILTVSGDGLINEIINGFAERLDARTAFDRIALVPIPAGSGNGFSINLLGVEVSL